VGSERLVHRSYEFCKRCIVHGGSAAEVWQRLGFNPTVVIANRDLDVVKSG
jgi:hypothetical protein